MGEEIVSISGIGYPVSDVGTREWKTGMAHGRMGTRGVPFPVPISDSIRGRWMRRLQISAIGVIGVLLWTQGMVGVALADLIGPLESVTGRADVRIADWERLLVAQWLLDYGYTPDEVSRWMTRLDDTAIHQSILQAENMGLPIGGGALEVIVVLLVILILIVILLKLLNKEVVIR